MSTMRASRLGTEDADGRTALQGGLGAWRGRTVGALPRGAGWAAGAALAGAVAAAAGPVHAGGGRHGRGGVSDGAGVGRLVSGRWLGRGGPPAARRAAAHDRRAADPGAGGGAAGAGEHRRVRDGQGGGGLGGRGPGRPTDRAPNGPPVPTAPTPVEAAAADLGPGGPSRADGLEKGGLTAALKAAGVAAGQAVAWADEMRLGLHGQVR